MLTASDFQKATGVSDYLRDVWFPNINAAMNKFGINTPYRQAHFLAQCGHESAGFSRVQESLNYSAAGLYATFSTRISKSDADRLGRQPGEAIVPKSRQQQIANIIYANRNGNGGVDSGDGWNYRGRGLIQITGRSNYQALVGRLGNDIVASPDLVAGYAIAADASAAWWSTHGLNALADKDDLLAITRIINGGTNGLDDRTTRLLKAKGVLCSG